MTYTRMQMETENALARALHATRQQEGGITLEDIARVIREELGADAPILIDRLIEATTCPMGICDGSGEVEDTYFDIDSKTYQPNGTKPCPHTL